MEVNKVDGCIFKNMETKYFTGIKFHSESGEFKSEASNSASEAFKVAKLGDENDYLSVVLYIIKENKKIAIPYSKIRHLDEFNGNLEKELEIIGNQIK